MQYAQACRYVSECCEDLGTFALLSEMGFCLQIQSSIGFSNYVQRDMALKHLIQPLAGEYGMHNGQEQGKF